MSDCVVPWWQLGRKISTPRKKLLLALNVAVAGKIREEKSLINRVLLTSIASPPPLLL